MPKSVAEGFDVFLNRLVPNQGEHDLAAKHKSSIQSCLERNFECSKFFETGSFGNHTGVRHYSDVDYFAGIPVKHASVNSTTFLSEVRAALSYTFKATEVKVSCPAVNIPFGRYASETVEVTPACFNGFARYDNKSFLNYRIPDCNGGWHESSPDAHNHYVRQVNEKQGYRVKPLIQLVKAWNYYKGAKIRSFYLELWVARYATTEPYIDYGTDLVRIFSKLEKDGLRNMVDPTGISGIIQPCKTSVQHAEAIVKINTASTRIDKAMTAAIANKLDDAFYWLNLLFDEKFPAR